MKTKIWISPYELRVRTSAVSLNRAPPVRAGVLIKVEFKPDVFGYADIHPWAEWGDEPLETQISRLRDGSVTALTRNSLKFAKADGEAREKGVSLWNDLKIPRSHFTAGDPEHFNAKTIEEAIAQGFDRIKVKLGKDPVRAAETLKKILPALGGKAKYRLDFNSQLNIKTYPEFLALIGNISDQIDFVEDPTPWDAKSGFNVDAKALRLAVDRYASKALESAFCPPVMILKPAIEDWENLSHRIARVGKQCVYTSYLDHPIGQMFAAWVAAKDPSADEQTHGLLSHTVYETNVFSEMLHHQGPHLTAPAGTGIGFDEALKKRSWTLLTGETPPPPRLEEPAEPGPKRIQSGVRPGPKK